MDIEKFVYELAVRANTILRRDVLNLINKAYLEERKIQPKKTLKVILDNALCAYKNRIALCQDTGLPLVFLECGKDVKVDYILIKRVSKALERAYRKEGFRASTVTPFNFYKPRFNPDIFHIEFTNRYGLRITIFPKGFGSENKSALKMFNPTVSQQEISEFIVDAVRRAGPSACPPFFIGVGIGGTADYALLLAKKALLERVDRDGRNEDITRWEKDLLKRINSLGIGPMGLGGNFTALCVKIKLYPTHIAGLPVGVNISCHSLRSATATIRI
ncbi:MAG: fumarate hydratase [Candidatus Omnitrophica bacterium]|nr:fumarate hydratase [Candidatus Omnitrophota bacterium]MCM8826782.1 fumarate hydratase [Candidatus Omnitrophota bacterium]